MATKAMTKDFSALEVFLNDMRYKIRVLLTYLLTSTLSSRIHQGQSQCQGLTTLSVTRTVSWFYSRPLVPPFF